MASVGPEVSTGRGVSVPRDGCEVCCAGCGVLGFSRDMGTDGPECAVERVPLTKLTYQRIVIFWQLKHRLAIPVIGREW
ncbi:hypothetical protein GCM10023318_02380 [Nocardia callitridis]|uniref:Uncharacterized protein n=1 Tax=Nocardia callitridis TaxID=648753 RepID=A0ABP9JTD3_9NOCA